MKFVFYDQPTGWPGPKVPTDMPFLYNIRQDPFERLSNPNIATGGAGYINDFFAREFWRFVVVQDKVKELAETAIEFPPMQDPASFNLDAVKKQVEDTIKAHGGR
jgi:hypothetical protein